MGSASPTLLSYLHSPLLLKDDSSHLPFPGSWQATCIYDLYDPGHSTNKDPLWEVHGQRKNPKRIQMLNKIRGGNYHGYRNDHSHRRVAPSVRRGRRLLLA